MTLQNEQNKEADFLAAAHQKAQRVKTLLEDQVRPHAMLYDKVKSIVESDNQPIADRQLLEAILRMATLCIADEAALGFIATGRPTMFLSPYKCAIPLDSAAIEEIVQFEREYGGVVYAVIRSDTEMGRLDALLYVCKTPDEWESDRGDIKDQTPIAYVVNQATPEFSEFGSIGIKVSPQGFLTRTA